MSIKKLFTTLFFILILLTLKGQHMEIRPSLGIGTYSMSKLKDLMQQSVDESPIALKTTQNFPPYWFYHLDIIQYPDSLVGYGFTSGYYSTGARNHYADYSGSYRDDIKASAINIGFLVAQRKALGNNIYGILELATGAKFTKLMFESELIIQDTRQLLSDEFRNLSWWVEPQVRLSSNITEKYALSFFAGYEFTVINNISIEAFNTRYDGTALNWSGLRAGISMSFIQKR